MEKKELTDALEQYKADVSQLVEDVKTASASEKAELQKSLDSAKDARDEMQKQLDDIMTEQKNAKLNIVKKDENVSFDQSIKSLVASDEYKKAVKAGFPKGQNTFEVKIDTSIITGDVNRTQQNMSINFAPENPMAFLPVMVNGFVGADKNRVLWVDGAYTSNVGYVTEGTGQATADTGTATEKYREMAKISAKLPITEEMLEDADYIASAFRSKMVEKATLFTDGEAYDGDGSDGVNPKHIYGIKGHATAYNSTTTGSVGTVASANIGDLVNDMILQAEKSNFRGSNVLWMNPTDFARFRYAKATDGQYLFVKETNGSFTISGVNVVRSNRVTAGDMLLADTSKLQYWTKRAAQVKFSQMNASDFVNDAWTAVMFVRSQVVVETPDKLSLIFVDDITAAIATLDSGV
jgi:HK97 family phage major capsid protein